MRPIYVSLLLSIYLQACPLLSDAQPGATFFAAYNKTLRAVAVAKTAGTGSRLKDELNGRFNASHVWLPDSIAYTYSGGRGGDYNDLSVTSYPIKYDGAVAFSTDSTTLTYKPTYRRTQTFDAAHGGVATQVTENWNGSAWINSARLLISYNSAGFVDSITNQSWNAAGSAWAGDNRIINIYNGSNQVVSSRYETWDATAGSYVYRIQYLYTYNAHGDQLLALNQSYNTGSMGWQNSFEVTYVYNASNLETSETFHQSSGTAWVNSDSTSLLYASGNQPNELIYFSWNTASSTWLKTQHILETYTATGQVQQELQQQWNAGSSSYGLADSTYRIYNANDQILTYYSRYYYSGIPTETRSRFDYEQYTTGIASGHVTAADIQVYPVPAAGVLNISLRLSEPQVIGYTIYDGLGRAVQSWNAALSAQYSRQLSVTDFPAGNYWLRASGKDINAVQQFSIGH